MKGNDILEVVTWFIFVGWAICYFIRDNTSPIEFLGLCIGLGLCCLAFNLRYLNRKDEN